MAPSEAKTLGSSPTASLTASPRASPKAGGASPRASPKASPTASPTASPRASPKANSNPAGDIDMSLLAWITDTYTVLHWPLTILSVLGLVVLGSFIEIAPRKSLEFLDTTLGRSLFFIFPFLIASVIDWPTGLLAGVVSLIIFARLQKQDSSEGFTDTSNTTDNSTKFISSPHRWFIERVLGESPLAISSDRITTSASKGSDIRSSSSSATSSSMSADRASSSATSSLMSANHASSSTSNHSMPADSSSSSHK